MINNEGVIIVGYQGIGKSSLASQNVHCIDLESGNFWIGDKRYDDWYIPYCNIALHLAQQGYVVFVSSHEVVRKYLVSLPFPKGVHLMCCVPCIGLKGLWVNKLYNRFQSTGLDKDYKAWMNAEHRFVENIQEILDDVPASCILTSLEYDLKVELQLQFFYFGWSVYI